MTDMVASGTLSGEFRAIGANHVHFVTIGRGHSGKNYALLINLSIGALSVALGSKTPATQAYDVCAGTNTAVAVTNGVYTTASVSVPTNSMRVFEWKP